MNPTLSPNDLDALSAYLDHQLPPAERAALEARLVSEPALRAELTELQAVQQALQSLPQLTSPRNLTLTAAQARPAQRVAVFPALVSGLSAVAAILLIVAGAGLLRPVSPSLNEAPLAAVAAAPSATASLPPPESPAARLMEISVTPAPATEGLTGDLAQPGESANATEPELGAADMAFAAQPPAAQEAQEAAADALLAGSAPEAGSGPGLEAAAPQSSPLPPSGSGLALQAQATAPAEVEATQLKEVTATPLPSATFTATASATPGVTHTATPAPAETPMPTPVPVNQSAGKADDSSALGLILLGLGGLLLIVAVWAWRRAR